YALPILRAHEAHIRWRALIQVCSSHSLFISLIHTHTRLCVCVCVCVCVCAALCGGGRAAERWATGEGAARRDGGMSDGGEDGLEERQGRAAGEPAERCRTCRNTA